MRGNAYYIILISALIYFFIYIGCGKEERGDELSIPDLLRRLLFPFLKYSRISIGFVGLACYFLLSNLFIYFKYFFIHIIQDAEWNWKRVNDSWILVTFAVMYVILIIDIGALILHSKDRWLGKLFLILTEIILIVGGIYYFVIPFFG